MRYHQKNQLSNVQDVENSCTKVKTVQSLLVASIAEVENIALKNTYALKKCAEMGQRSALTPLDVLSAQGHTWQTM